MAALCCEAFHSFASAWWQPAQASLPTKVAADELSAATLSLMRKPAKKPTPVTATAAIAAASHIQRRDRTISAGAGRDAAACGDGSADRFRDRFVVADFCRLRAKG